MTDNVPPADLDVMVECASDLTALFYEVNDRFSSSSTGVGRQFAAAGLLRGLDLLGAAVAVLNAGHPDAVGAVVRPIVETWLTSMYLLLGEAAALGALEHELNRNERAMMNSNDIDLGDLFEERERELRDAARYAGVLGEEDVFGKKLTTLDIASRVEAALVDEPGALGIYNMMFRTYSTHETHGLSPVRRRVNSADVDDLRLQEPKPIIDPRVSIGMAALLMCDLAHRVTTAFEQPSDELEAISDRLMGVFSATGEAVIGSTPPEIRDLVPERFADLDHAEGNDRTGIK